MSCIIFHCLKRSGFSTPIASPTSSRKLTTLNGDVGAQLAMAGVMMPTIEFLI